MVRTEGFTRDGNQFVEFRPYRKHSKIVAQVGADQRWFIYLIKAKGEVKTLEDFPFGQKELAIRVAYAVASSFEV